MKKTILILLLLQNLSSMNQKAFPTIAYNLYSNCIINAFNSKIDDLEDFASYYENIEQATRSFYMEFPDEQDSLFDELKAFCNDYKNATEQLSEEEIKNILNLFLNDINNFEIKYNNQDKLQTTYSHIKSKAEAETICKNLAIIMNQQKIENRILTTAIKVRLNQLKQKYKITNN